MKRFVSTLAAVALLAAAGRAMAMEKIVLALGLSHGTADIASNKGNGTNSAFQTPELGGRLEYWNMMAENYGLNFAANIGFSSETDKLRTDAKPLEKEGKFTTSSWSVRLGGDRIYSPNDKTTIFFGPGLEYWNGKAKFVDIGFPGTYETETVSRFSLHGHMGGMMALGSNWGMTGQLGHKIGIANYKEKGGKTSWWPSSIDGSMAFYFSFGGAAK